MQIAESALYCKLAHGFFSVLLNNRAKKTSKKTKHLDPINILSQNGSPNPEVDIEKMC